MDYPCAKFDDFSFSCFGFIVRTDRHRVTDRVTGVVKNCNIFLEVEREIHTV